MPLNVVASFISIGFSNCYFTTQKHVIHYLITQFGQNNNAIIVQQQALRAMQRSNFLHHQTHNFVLFKLHDKFTC
jgi:hypothetical protein